MSITGGPTITNAAITPCLSATRRHRAARHSASSIHISRERKSQRVIGGIAGFTKVNRIDRRLLEHARAFEPIQEGRIYIEKLNGPFLFIDKGSPAEYSAGLKLAVERGWLRLHESGTYVKFTPAGAELFA